MKNLTSNRYFAGGRYWTYEIDMPEFVNEYNAKCPNEKMELTGYEDELIVDEVEKQFDTTRDLLEFLAYSAVHPDLESLLDVDIDYICFNW